MISRRAVIIGLCGSSCRQAYSGANANAQELNPFVCLTIDTVPTDPELLNFDKVWGNPQIVDVAPPAGSVSLTPYGTALIGNRWLLSDGLTPNSGRITLGINFLNGNADQQTVVKSAAAAWLKTDVGKRFSLEFDVSRDKSHARISFDPTDSNWSYIGRKSLNYKKTVKTMNISQVIEHVAQHELGHLFGLEHEHQFPGTEIHWHDRVVIDFMKTNNVPAIITQQQILRKFSREAICIGDPHLNPQSVMMYPILPGWADFDDGSGVLKPLVVPGNSLITDRDVKCLRGIYQV
jgi:hypothetical protein